MVNPELRKGGRLRLAIADVDADGYGVTAGAGASVVRVGRALPGETVVAEVEHTSPHGRGTWARLVDVVEPSPDRVAPACRAWGRCGGCVLEHWAYPRQLEWKRARVAAALQQLGVPVEPTVASPRIFGYRNRSKLVFAREGGRYVLGAYAPRSHDVVELAGCAIAEPPLDDIAVVLADLATAQDPPEGLLRYAILRRSFDGKVLAMLVVARAGEASTWALARRLAEVRPEVVAVVENLNTSTSDVLVGDEAPDRVLVGPDPAVLDEKIGDVSLLASPRAFLQINRDVAARLYADLAAAARLDGTQRVIDVYAGAGAIALTVAPRAASVVGVEDNPAAVDDARAAAARAGVGHVSFIAGDAATALADVAAGDVVVVDPPRKGLAPSVIEACVRLAPRTILYASCGPDSLARDLARFVDGGYAVARVTPYDMLPHTAHVEALAVLDRT